MKPITFVTSNKGKIKEAQQILGEDMVTIEKLDLEEIQSMDIAEIALRKAKQAYNQLQKPVIVDDVGLYVTTWGGFPGPFIKFMTPEGSNDLVLRLLRHEEDRSVILRAAIAYADGTVSKVFIGEVRGSLTDTPRGEKGWGFDPILIPEGYTETFAELGPEIKHAMSHRGSALKQLREYLES